MSTPQSGLAWKGCPWFHRTASAAFAAESVMRLLDPDQLVTPFASRKLETMFRFRGGMTLDIVAAKEEADEFTRESRLLGALVHKYATRGRPAPCSIELERFILQQAEAANVLEWNEDHSSGEIRFTVTSQVPDLQTLLKVCLIPELCVSDEEVAHLDRLYQDLCTRPETAFFQSLSNKLGDSRLALLFRPQREFGGLVQSFEQWTTTIDEADRVDFAFDTLGLEGLENPVVRHVIEIDDAATHSSQTAKAMDNTRSSLLRQSQWSVHRVREADSVATREAHLDAVVTAAQTAIGDDLLNAADSLRTLKPRLRQVLIDLVALPVAEAQLLTAVAYHLHANPQRRALTIENPTGMNLDPVIASINQTLRTFAELHDISPCPRLDPVSAEPADFAYFGFPSAKAWEALGREPAPVVISPAPVPVQLLEPLLPSKQSAVVAQSEERRYGIDNSLEYLLQQLFRKVEFRRGQLEVVRRALAIKDVVGLLPTGAGKSICYQLVAFCQPGLTLVVDPLVSLIIDQYEGLRLHGIHRAIDLHGGLNRHERNDRYLSLEQAWPAFSLVAPERLHMPEFRQHIERKVVGIPIVYCVVDEAHCVSEWGHDFRPSYLNIGKALADYCTTDGENPPVLVGLTGTASENVLIDVQRELRIDDPESVVRPATFDRTELEFVFQKVPVSQRRETLKEALRSAIDEFSDNESDSDSYPSGIPSGLIFSYFINPKDLGTDQIAKDLSSDLGLDIGMYAGTKPRGTPMSDREWNAEKQRLQLDFKRGTKPILVCTHAFGMGIDKPDVRFTIHAMLPRSLEEFYQQAGRAGRDQKTSRCIVIFTDDDPERSDVILSPDQIRDDEVEDLSHSDKWWEDDDALRSLWFHRNAYRGREFDLTAMKRVIDSFVTDNLPTGHIGPETVDIAFDWLERDLPNAPELEGARFDEYQTILEKAIYRLQEIGAIQSYMKDYARNKFCISLRRPTTEDLYNSLNAFLERYPGHARKRVSQTIPSGIVLGDAMAECARQLVDHIYDTIEGQRRTAMRNMLLAARVAVTPDGERQFRNRLLTYLGESEFSAALAGLDPDEISASVEQIMSQVFTTGDLSELLGACQRSREEDPENPTLLLLEGLALISGSQWRNGVENLRAGFNMGLLSHADTEDQKKLIRVVLDASMSSETMSPEAPQHVLETVMRAEFSKEVQVDAARYCYEHAPHGSGVCHRSLEIMMSYLLDHLQDARRKGGDYVIS